jgi:hypothetical protein
MATGSEISPNAVGSVSGPIDSTSPKNDPGHPWRDQQWQRIRLAGADVDVVEVEAVDTRHQLRQGVELCLGLAPVVVGPPIEHELLESSELYAL